MWQEFFVFILLLVITIGSAIACSSSWQIWTDLTVEDCKCGKDAVSKAQSTFLVYLFISIISGCMLVIYTGYNFKDGVNWILEKVTGGKSGGGGGPINWKEVKNKKTQLDAEVTPLGKEMIFNVDEKTKIEFNAEKEFLPGAESRAFDFYSNPDGSKATVIVKPGPNSISEERVTIDNKGTVIKHEMNKTPIMKQNLNLSKFTPPGSKAPPLLQGKGQKQPQFQQPQFQQHQFQQDGKGKDKSKAKSGGGDRLSYKQTGFGTYAYPPPGDSTKYLPR